MKRNFIINIFSFAASLYTSEILAHATSSSGALGNAKRPLVKLLFSDDVNRRLKSDPLPPETNKVVSFLEDKLHIKFDMQRVPWKRAVSMAIDGHGLIIGISKTKERLKYLNFSEAISADHIWLVTRCDKQFTFNGLPDLMGKTIGMVRGTSAGEAFDSNANKLFKIEEDTDSTEARFLKLFEHRMDALIFFKDSKISLDTLSRDINQRYSMSLQAESTNESLFCVLKTPLATIPLHIALSTHVNQDILKKINQVIIDGRKSGDLYPVPLP